MILTIQIIHGTRGNLASMRMRWPAWETNGKITASHNKQMFDLNSPPPTRTPRPSGALPPRTTCTAGVRQCLRVLLRAVLRQRPAGGARPGSSESETKVISVSCVCFFHQNATSAHLISPHSDWDPLPRITWLNLTDTPPAITRCLCSAGEL